MISPYIIFHLLFSELVLCVLYSELQIAFSAEVSKGCFLLSFTLPTEINKDLLTLSIKDTFGKFIA